jgi:ribose transport system permease protein
MINKELGKNIYGVITRQKALLAVIALFVIMIFFDTNFYSSYNLFDLLKSASILEILAFGMTITMIAGGIDLSVGGVMITSGIITIMLMDYMPMPLAILCAIVGGGIVGFVNGFFTVRQKAEPFIITLGMGMLLTGASQQLTNAHPISAKDPNFTLLANGKLFDMIPYLVIIMFAVGLIMHIVLSYTQFGRSCYAIGGDYNVALNSGINAVRIKWASYVICGITAALAGVMLSSKLNTGASTYGGTTALWVICGAVIGGTSVAGGIGGIPQTAVGLLVLALLQNCMNMLGIQAYIQQVIQGVVIIGIIWLDCYGIKRKREAV